MRLVTFTHPSFGDFPHLGAHIAADDVVVDFTASLAGCPATMRGFLEGGAEMLSAACAVAASSESQRYPFSEVTLKVSASTVSVLGSFPD
jgi:hypothetical protein